MNTYTISIFREIHYKMDVSAESLTIALKQVEERGLEAGKLCASVMTEAQELDEESIKMDNASRFPEEVALYSGLTVEQLKQPCEVGTVSTTETPSPPLENELTDDELEALWLELFTKVLLIDEFELGEEFHIFGKGAQLQDIGTYFDYYHSKGVRYLCEKFVAQMDNGPRQTRLPENVSQMGTSSEVEL